MRLDVLEADTLARVGWVDVWVSLYWDTPYYSEGGFTLEVRPTAENLQLLQEGRWLVRSDENPRIPMRICSRTNQNEDANLVVSGYPATWLLTKRVSAVSIKNQNAEAAMRSLVEAAKPWPRLELGTEYGFDTTFDDQTAGGSVFDYCQTIGQACDLGFRVILDGTGDSKRLLFECFRPTFDPNARYAPQYGNLTDLTYTESITDYKNVCVVVGAEGTATVGAAENTGSARRELIVDATSKKKEGGQSQADYLAALRAQGEQELAKHTRLENFRFTPTGSITVGMVVEASLPGTDIQAAARITSVTLSSQKGKNSVSTEIGTPIIRRKQ